MLARKVYKFGDFSLHPLDRQLVRHGRPVPLTAKAFDTLHLLVAHARHLCSKSQILEAVWPGMFVEEGNLAVTVHMLRRALGDDAKGRRYIETVAKSGYRFIAEVDEQVDREEAGIAVLGAPTSKPSSFSVSSSPRSFRNAPSSSGAYQLYLQGRYFWNKRTELGLRRSIVDYRQATAQDPHCAVAYVGLADSYALFGSYGLEPTHDAYPIARSAALKALQLDSSLAEAYTSLGMISFHYEWDWMQAEREFRRSIELDPGYAMAHTWYAIRLAALGRGNEAIEQVQQAWNLDPVSLIINTEVGRVFYLTRNFDQAIAAFRRVIDLDPQFARAHTRLGMTFAAQRRFGDAIDEFSRAQRMTGPDPYLDGLLGYTYGVSGESGTARRLLKNLRERSQNGFVPSFSMALVCVGLGELDEAITLLSQSCQDRSTYMVYAKSDPLLDPVRSDPRFIELLREVGLA